MQPADTAKDALPQIRLDGRLVMTGFGSVGQAVLPLLISEFKVDPDRITIIKTRPDESGLADRAGVRVVVAPLKQDNYASVLEGLLGSGDFLLNLSVSVSSLDLAKHCRRVSALYLDTCTEPWPGHYDNPDLPLAQRTNYALREKMLAFKRESGPGPTAVMTQGANPGLVSSLTKQALLNMAADTGLDHAVPADREGWARLARRLEVKVIHIAERDTQTGSRRKRRGEFVNTWSVHGFLDEGMQPAELGWGLHEKHWPADACAHDGGSQASIFLKRPGMSTRVRSWTPLEGPYHGFLITHAESISLADYLSLHEGGKVVWRPTVHYAYHPCDDAVLSVHELAGKQWQEAEERRILREEIEEGVDELGVLLMGNRRGVYWYGSRLSIEQARALAPWNNATSLQVVAGILGGMAWAIRNPQAGVVEPEELDHRLVLQVASPWLGNVPGVWGDWTPLQHRGELFEETIDADDPWQFLNIRVA